MREYLLYIKVGTGRVQAYVTPCFTVDKSFWQEREGCQLHVIGKSPSLALAFSLRERLNERLWEREARRRPMNEEALEDLRQMAVSCVRESDVMYGRRVSGGEPLPRKWFTWEGEQEEQPDARRNDQPTFPSLSAILSGRALLMEEAETLLGKRNVRFDDLDAVLQRMVLTQLAEWRPGVTLTVKKGWLRHRLELTCQRCGSGGQELELTICHTCGQGCAYCTVCLGMGRSKCCMPYLLVPAKHASLREAKQGDVARLEWSGQYSKEQAVAAEAARRFVANPRPDLSEFLIWAVCGAGKTELLFPSVTEALSAGGSVLIATPRKDVVLELAPRLQRVFPYAKVIAVHGSSPEKWEDSDITIATTHQVMRYYRRFPLVILDEVDAFPYHNNRVLYRAVARAVQKGGKMLYLSATPPRYLQRRLVERRGFFPVRRALPLASPTHVLLPGRYHGFTLPVPEVITVKGLHKSLGAGRAIAPLLEAVSSSLEAQRQVFLFVPRIDDVERVLDYMQKMLPDHAQQMAGVHAADPLREEKVRAFRDKRYVLMVTTTILERGVTIPRSDVVVIGAEAPVFDEASLVQIAGRVGRSADYPTGTVLFLQADRAGAPRAAVRQIEGMNRLADALRLQEKKA